MCQDLADPDPLDEALCRVTWMLLGLSYSDIEIRSIVEHCREEGSAEACIPLADEHVPHVEALLPMSSAWESPEWDSEHVNLGPLAVPIH
jgi:hypothetical protein